MICQPRFGCDLELCFPDGFADAKKLFSSLSRVLSVDTLVKLCTALKMCPNELLGMDYMEMTPQMPDRLRMFSQAVSQAVMDIARQHFDDGDAEEE